MGLPCSFHSYYRMDGVMDHTAMHAHRPGFLQAQEAYHFSFTVCGSLGVNACTPTRRACMSSLPSSMAWLARVTDTYACSSTYHQAFTATQRTVGAPINVPL